MPFVSPVTIKELAVAVPVAVWETPEAVQVAANPVAAVPVDAFVKATVICAAPAVAEVIVGLVGTTVTPSTGMTLTAAEATLFPLVLAAMTVQEYKLPLVSPVTVKELAVAVPVAVWETPEAEQVAV